MSLEQDLAKIEYALGLARKKAETFTSGRIKAELKAGGDPVTAADIEINSVLQETLVETGDGWLSEETVDDLVRLGKHRVWIVDPVDGTREFIAGIDEWCISVALAEGGKVVAAGICSPSTDQLYLGSIETGVTLNGKPSNTTDRTELQGATVLASRSEVDRGQWDRFTDGPLDVIPMGSVAYKLARVSAGLADATFTLVPKNEWDIAAGTLLVEAAGGKVLEKNGKTLVFNREKTLISGLIASGTAFFDPLSRLIAG